MHWLVAFGRFWYDFIVGDAAVLAVGGVAVLILGRALVQVGGRAAAEVALPLAVIATPTASLVPLRR